MDVMRELDKFPSSIESSNINIGDMKYFVYDRNNNVVHSLVEIAYAVLVWKIYRVTRSCIMVASDDNRIECQYAV